MVGTQTTRFDVESLRSRLRSMDDAELLQFGQAAKYMCSTYAHSLAPLREEVCDATPGSTGRMAETLSETAHERIGLTDVRFPRCDARRLSSYKPAPLCSPKE